MIVHLPKQVSSGRVIAAALSPRRRHSLLRLPRRCALTSRHDPAAIYFGRCLLLSSDQSCGGSVRNSTHFLRVHTSPTIGGALLFAAAEELRSSHYILHRLSFARRPQNIKPVVPFCPSRPSTSARGTPSTVHAKTSTAQKQILNGRSCYGPAGLEHIASRSCGEA